MFINAQNVAAIIVVSLTFAAIMDLLLVIADQYNHRLFKTPIEVQMIWGDKNLP
jgi:hypothetical protein